MRFILGLLLALGSVGPALAGTPPDGEETEPEPDLRVETCEDVVILTDGTKIVGTIIAAGGRALVVIEKGATAERVIMRSDIERFGRGETSGEIVGYQVGVNPDEGLLVIDDGSGGTSTSTDPAPDPPAPVEPARPVPADIGELWKLLGGSASAAELAAAFKTHPDWGQAVVDMKDSGNLPVEGKMALLKFKTRLLGDVGLRDELAKLAKEGKLPPGALEIMTAL